MPTAHPRSRGEHLRAAHRQHELAGSSPLTRGALRFARAITGLQGLIPAHAGSTSTPWRPGKVLCGSSPLTRGAQELSPARRTRAGLIPAHAGSTHWWGEALADSGAHPRSRGEHHLGCGVGNHHLGSSPLTRGALLFSQFTAGAKGLIPAHAGSTFSSLPPRVVPRAHPRSRGEHMARIYLTGSGAGSSPLTRGARPPRCPAGPGAGLIPAHAGSTRARCVRWRCLGAHPRSRGEHVWIEGISEPYDGSSPLTRGAHLLEGGDGCASGLIPAHAGSTLSGLRKGCLSTD